MGKNAEHPGYKKMKDTPWIKQGREIADIGGKGILDNYNRVNVFDADTRNSIDQINKNVYNRAFKDMEDAYNNTMNAYAARNYNRFGSLNNTPSSYIVDEYQKDFQRQMDDLAYNKAVNYENLINNELNRRYNTLNMFQNMYGYGETPYKQDVSNWNVENTNRDIAYKNQLPVNNNAYGLLNTGINALGNIGSSFLQGGYVGGMM